MSAPFEMFRVGEFVKGWERGINHFWRVHVEPVPSSDDEYVAQRNFIESAIREKLEREAKA